jgi:hypothetical protein
MPDPMMLEAELAARSSVMPLVSRANDPTTSSSPGIDECSSGQSSLAHSPPAIVMEHAGFSSPPLAENSEFVDAGLDTLASSAPTMPIDDFIDNFRKPLSQHILSSPPRLRITRVAWARAIEDEDLIPKRSARLAAKSKFREPKPEAQARKVMMKRLGVEVEMQLPDEASFDEF